MISARMSRPIKVPVLLGAAIVVAAVVSACGTEKIQVPGSSPLHSGAVLFAERCSGCHTLAYAATHGSAANVRTREITNGPNFNVRCERPIARVIYAIENGGFSGAIMPQNIVVGKDAEEVARFVATYAGRKAPKAPGVTSCEAQPIGSIPAATTPTTATATAVAATTSTPATTPAGASKSGKAGKKRPGK
jgi:mono/diheme cytochrome c family protein